MSNAEVTADLTQVPEQANDTPSGGNDELGLRVEDSTGLLTMILLQNTFRLRRQVGDSREQKEVPFDRDRDRFWQIQIHDNQALFQTSRDDDTYLTLHTIALDVPPTEATIAVYGGYFNGGLPVPGAAELESLAIRGNSCAPR